MITDSNVVSAHSCGSFILYRSRLIFNCSWMVLNGSFLIAKFSDQGLFYRNACIFASNRNPDRDTFTSCTDLVDLTVPMVLCGDFNAVFDRALDCWGVAAGSLYHNSSSALALLFCTCCVVDTWRHLHPDSISFSWMRPGGAHASRIDFFGCPVSSISGVSTCDLLVCPYSDHSAVYTELVIPSCTRGVLVVGD